MSVLWTLDAESFEVQDVWFGRTLIRCVQLSLRQGVSAGQCCCGTPAVEWSGLDAECDGWVVWPHAHQVRLGWGCLG